MTIYNPPNKGKLNLLLVGDTHGAIDDLAHTVLQVEQKIEIDYILQAGDFGLYRSFQEITAKSKKHYNKNPEKHGQCFDYASGIKKFPKLLLFINGNHEDYDFYETMTIDNLIHLTSGVYDLMGFPGPLVTLDGIWYQGDNEEKAKLRNYTQFKDFKRVLTHKYDQEVFMLLTHDCPTNAFPDQIKHKHGSFYVDELLKELKPKYLVHGHYHFINQVYKKYDTTCICLGKESVKLLSI